MKTYTRFAAFTAFSAFIAFGAVENSSADSLALSFTGGTNTSGNVPSGWSFTTSKTITVSSLGWFDEGSNGLNASHQVGIWTTGGALLMSATVASGTTEPILSGFRLDSTITGAPLLTPGTYVIGGVSTANDFVRLNTSSLTLAPEITYVAARTGSGSAFTFPSTTSSGFKGIFGPSFTFAAPTPAPSSALVILLGAVPLVGVLRKRRRK